MSSLSADFTTPFSKIGPQYLHPSHRITGGGLLPTTPTMRARTSPPTESPQHQFSADSSRFPKAPPVSADWGPAPQFIDKGGRGGAGRGREMMSTASCLTAPLPPSYHPDKRVRLIHGGVVAACGIGRCCGGAAVRRLTPAGLLPIGARKGCRECCPIY